MDENRHSAWDLKQMQSLPLEAKITMTKRRIRDWYDYWNGDVYVSFSGGNDSTVLKHIVDSTSGVYDVPAVFVNTGLEYPEIQQFVRDVKSGKWDCFNSNVEIIRPEMRFDEVIQKYGYPVISKRTSETIEYAKKNIKEGKNGTVRVRLIKGEEFDKQGRKSIFNAEKYAYLLDAPFNVSNKCCNVMKKRPIFKYQKLTGRVPYVGTMASESKQREMAWLISGCNGFNQKKPQSKPLSFWTEQDILHYIKQFNVPYCPVYGDIQVKQTVDNDKVFECQINMIDYLGCYEPEDKLETTGCDRTGCMFCMFGCHLEKEPNRFQRMKVTHPRQYEYCMNQLGLKEVLEYIGVPYE